MQNTKMECKYVLRNRNVYDCADCYSKNHKLNKEEAILQTISKIEEKVDRMLDTTHQWAGSDVVKLNNNEIRAANVLASKFTKSPVKLGNTHIYFDKSRVYPLVVKEPNSDFTGLRRSTRIAGKERVDYSDMDVEDD